MSVALEELWQEGVSLILLVVDWLVEFIIARCSVNRIGCYGADCLPGECTRMLG